MKFQQLKWHCADDSPHYVIEVSFDKVDISKAQEIANTKISYINVHAPSGLKRSNEVIKNRIIAGKLADHGVQRLIQHRIAELHLPCSITEYDATRVDDYKNPDPYDLLLTMPEGEQTIEVRSSFSYLLAPSRKIIEKLSVYGWYTSGNKPCETQRDWYWQVVYYLRPRDIQLNNNSPVTGVFEDKIDQGEVTGYIVGGATQQLLQTKGRSRKDQDGADYVAISPICSALDCISMLSAMLPR